MASKPQTWKPTDTTVNVPGVGTVACHAEYQSSEDEGGQHYVDRTNATGGGWVKNQRTVWTVTVHFEGYAMSSPYTQGSAYDAPPKADSVLYSLASDASGADATFEDFCSDYGYDNDSRTAERTWDACRETELQLRRMFGPKYDDVQKWSYGQ